MSRSETDWQLIRVQVLQVRNCLQQAMELLDDWPAQFDETAEQADYIARKIENEVVSKVNTILGQITVDWVDYKALSDG